MKPIKPTSKHPRGLSMIELLLVVAGIGTLAAIALPVVQNVKTNAYNVKLDTSIAVLNSAVKSYLANGGEILLPPRAGEMDSILAIIADPTGGVVALQQFGVKS